MRMKKTTGIVLAWELYEQGLSKSAVSRRLGRNRETIIEWIKGIEAEGLKPFLEVAQIAGKGPRPAASGEILIVPACFSSNTVT